MNPGGQVEREGGMVEPTDLTYVGPATAEIIERAPFDCTDLLDRSVSYTQLLKSGVNPGVAGKLRREYSLVWAFDWVAGANLAFRANLVSGLDPDQRRWIADSPSSTDGKESPLSESEIAWRERTEWVESPRGGEPRCERCDGSLIVFQLDERQTVQCQECGFVGVPLRFEA